MLTDDEYLKFCDRNAAQLLKVSMDQVSSKTLSIKDKPDIALQSMGIAAAKLVCMITAHMPESPIDNTLEICTQKLMGSFTAALTIFSKEIPTAIKQVLKDKAKGVYGN